jgi:hypothetical protein
MIRKTVAYKDIDGNEVSEDLYFHLFGMQLAKLQGQKGGLKAVITEMMSASNDDDSEGAMKMLRRLIRMSYGTRTEGGKFEPSTKKEAKAFMSSLACDAMLTSLMDGTGKAASDFFVGILPEGMITQAEIVQASQPNTQGMRSISDSSAEPPWIKEDRDPTQTEVKNMTHEQLIEAFKARTRRQSSQE